MMDGSDTRAAVTSAEADLTCPLLMARGRPIGGFDILVQIGSTSCHCLLSQRLSRYPGFG
jgi:hypothetical protein